MGISGAALAECHFAKSKPSSLSCAMCFLQQLSPVRDTRLGSQLTDAYWQSLLVSQEGVTCSFLPYSTQLFDGLNSGEGDCQEDPATKYQRRAQERESMRPALLRRPVDPQ